MIKLRRFGTETVHNVQYIHTLYVSFDLQNAPPVIIDTDDSVCDARLWKKKGFLAFVNGTRNDSEWSYVVLSRPKNDRIFVRHNATETHPGVIFLERVEQNVLLNGG